MRRARVSKADDEAADEVQDERDERCGFPWSASVGTSVLEIKRLSHNAWSCCGANSAMQFEPLSHAYKIWKVDRRHDS